MTEREFQRQVAAWRRELEAATREHVRALLGGLERKPRRRRREKKRDRSEYHRSRYHERKAAGLCPRCPARPEPGKVYCNRCEVYLGQWKEPDASEGASAAPLTSHEEVTHEGAARESVQPVVAPPPAAQPEQPVIFVEEPDRPQQSADASSPMRRGRGRSGVSDRGGGHPSQLLPRARPARRRPRALHLAAVELSR